MKYRISRRADQDIVTLFLYGASEYGLEQAEQYQQGLGQALEFISENPRIARERPELHGLRLYRYRAHVVVYAIRTRNILIVRILHARQDWLHHL